MGVQMEPYPELSDSFWRDCLKSLASLKTNASKPTKQSKEGSFRCDMTAISVLETLLTAPFILLRREAVAAVNEESPHVIGTHGRQCSTHRLYQGLLGAGADLPEDVLYLREGFLYGIEVRGVGR